jgi:hypothetical protein
MTLDILNDGIYSGFWPGESLKDVQMHQLMASTGFEAWLGITSEVKFDELKQKDLLFLRDDVDAIFIQSDFNTDTKSNQPPKAKQQREHALNEEIEKAFTLLSEKEKTMPSALNLWKYMKKTMVGEGVIVEMDNWTVNDTEITWVSHRGKDQTTSRRTFENILSKLRTSDKK